jgi:hypothetical protein
MMGWRAVQQLNGIQLATLGEFAVNRILHSRLNSQSRNFQEIFKVSRTENITPYLSVTIKSRLISMSTTYYGCLGKQSS